MNTKLFLKLCGQHGIEVINKPGKNSLIEGGIEYELTDELLRSILTNKKYQIAVADIFVVGNFQFVCEKSEDQDCSADDCIRCSFYATESCLNYLCRKGEREDNNNVYFSVIGKEVE